VPARLLIFGLVACWRRPDIVGGFHLLVNGLAAGLLARLAGGRSLYFNVGGTTELLGGGVWGENRLFPKMETPDPVVERRLLSAVGGIDYVITMGTGAAEFFRDRRVKAERGGSVQVVPGGIDGSRFGPGTQESTTDLIIVGRLVEVKRMDVFLEVVRVAANTIPEVSATIVGDGGLRAVLKEQAHKLGLDNNVRFVGHQKDVGAYLKQARIFVLTSDSEGLALSLMEALTCGLPAVVSDVGDLGDLVEDGISGFLIQRRRPDLFAQRIVSLLQDQAKLASFRQAALRAAKRVELSEIAKRWDEILKVE